MRKVYLGGLVYKAECVALPDSFDEIHDRFMELDNKESSSLTPQEKKEFEDLARKMWHEVTRHGNYAINFDQLLVLESEDGGNVIWEDGPCW